MKKAAMLLAAVGLLALAGCGVLPISPSSVKIEGTTYRTGFYPDDLWAKSVPYTEEEYKIGGVRFRLLEGGTFDCARGDTGPKSGGMIYVAAAQFEQAKAYYADPEQYGYYCIIGSKLAKEGEKKVFEIEDIDLEQYDALMDRGGAYNYDPFDPVKNAASEFKSVDFDTRKIDVRPFISFYRESRDGLFTSSKASKFFILDGKMYLARYWNGKEERVSAVEIPEENSAYFVALVEEFNAVSRSKA